MSDPIRRSRFDHTGVQLGTHLLFCTSAYQLALGYAEFTGFTGLTPAQVYSDPVVATPLPIYPDPAGTGQRRRWAGVAPEALWHPLFWLPARLNQPMKRGGTVEPDPTWAVRVCLEVQAAGLYDPDRGWVDVLAEQGLRTEDPDDMARVLSWLTGQPDPVLDGIDLDDRFVYDPDQDWAVDLAAGITLNVQGRAWAVVAEELLSILDDAAARPSEAAALAQTVLDLAHATLLDVDVPDLEQPSTYWAQVDHDVDVADDATTVLGRLEAARGWLGAVRDHYWPHIDVLDQLAVAADTGADPSDEVERANS